MSGYIGGTRSDPCSLRADAVELRIPKLAKFSPTPSFTRYFLERYWPATPSKTAAFELF